jgi:hypothetical protein
LCWYSVNEIAEAVAGKMNNATIIARLRHW